MPEHRDARAVRGWADLGVRLLYLLGAFALVWVAQRQGAAVRRELTQTFEFPIASWLLFLGIAALAGVAATFAARLPARGPYRWWRAVALVALPVLVLAVGPLWYEGIWAAPQWLADLALGGMEPVVAFLVGMGIAAGFPARAD